MLKQAIAVTFVALIGLVMAGCNTVEGVGRDTEAVGEGIQNIASPN